MNLEHIIAFFVVMGLLVIACGLILWREEKEREK